MKRFITYLYVCENGIKLENVGFCRVNIQGQEMGMEIFLRMNSRKNAMADVYSLKAEKGLRGLSVGTMVITDGQGGMQCHMAAEELEGIGLRLTDGTYIASCWRDTYAKEIVSGDFQTEEDILLQVTEDKEMPDEGIEQSKEAQPLIIYEKIDLHQLRQLPGPNQQLYTNSFLLHGFWNYGYLVLKKKVENGVEKVSLGVPGTYEKPEAIMAISFGFPYFEFLEEKEKNQEPKPGDFGGWFVPLLK